MHALLRSQVHHRAGIYSRLTAHIMLRLKLVQFWRGLRRFLVFSMRWWYIFIDHCLILEDFDRNILLPSLLTFLTITRVSERVLNYPIFICFLYAHLKTFQMTTLFVLWDRVCHPKLIIWRWIVKNFDLNLLDGVIGRFAGKLVLAILLGPETVDVHLFFVNRNRSLWYTVHRILFFQVLA